VVNTGNDALTKAVELLKITSPAVDVSAGKLIEVSEVHPPKSNRFPVDCKELKLKDASDVHPEATNIPPHVWYSGDEIEVINVFDWS